MDDRENRRREMFIRVQEFGRDHATDFPATGMGTQLFTALSSVISHLDSYATTQASAGGSAIQKTVNRSQAREALREDLEALNRTARAMADEVPGLDDKFRLPRGNNDQNLLHAGRAALLDAEPLAAQLIAHELPADFVAELNAHVDAFDLSMQAQAGQLGQRVLASAAIDTAIEEGNATVRKLDAIVKNKYRNQPAFLAQWTSASHTARSPRRSETTTPPPPPGSGSGTGTGTGGSTPPG